MDYEPSSRSAPNAIQRLKDRGRYDQQTVFSVLDQGTVAHVTFKLPQNDDDVDDWPVIIPMIYGRDEETIFLHGHLGSRLLNMLSEDDVKSCITVTNVDGLVISLTPFHNSNNYSSCVLFGHSRLVSNPDEKLKALKLITNKPFDKTGGDRWDDSRAPSQVDVQSTRVVAFQIEMASAKVREGGPKDEKKDIDNPEVGGKYWSGHLIREDHFKVAVPSTYCKVEMPDYIRRMVT
ncbi:hypothetical protein K435DRAFT_668251 [Dendrothele bispora CBS 962.96]|uniref:Flavin-nucleotide-binding protein n=1 Tax=Dendrothele bispora (strain CBS 962.96) TaxID=1314807 RepID=A0A4S8LZ71_DENBC|nr:hypothetical protein K435DRAFT_668251 [Dendrothele bispora CBS 962.96]